MNTEKETSSPRQGRKIWILRALNPQSIVHAARTAVAALISLIMARWCRLPEAYWATVTALIVMQSNLGAAWKISLERLAGTATGAIMAALLATFLKINLIVFGCGIFITGILCSILHLDRIAYRYAGITLTIIVLISRSSGPWTVALHRFIEISIGIAVGLAVTAVWPEAEPPKVGGA